MLLAHEDDDALMASAIQLRELGGRARRLLEEVVAEQQLERTALSASARQLNDAGFIFVRDVSTYFEKKYLLASSFAGEEALERLEELDEANKAMKAPSNKKKVSK